MLLYIRKLRKKYCPGKLQIATVVFLKLLLLLKPFKAQIVILKKTRIIDMFVGLVQYLEIHV